MDVNYIGEHLLPGQLGRLFVVSAFFLALSSALAYTFSTNSKELNSAKSWRNLGRFLFAGHGLSILGIIVALFYIIYNHLFEYYYAWQHSSTELPTQYILSCFWEGQEGSFLLWAFWHVVLGIVLIFRANKWEAPVMAVMAITQAFLASMLLGLYIGDYKIGSNPFLLLREAMDAPIFARADYLQFITDGNGLNPLLQNYWMTIHPPTLFLGFAATIIPFSFVIASLWKKEYKDWIGPALPWSLFAMLILGVGILMGGAWAYEALTFGGFWAWDPVENASLVPWLTLAGGVHCLLIYKHTGHALKITFILLILSFLLILYSTFLTRSGILGDTSVHSFTDLGMSGQLVFFMLFFVFISLFFLIKDWRKLPEIKKEESTTSREFWIFIGALIFTISAFQISFTTSIPVFNKFFPFLSKIPVIGNLFEKELAPPVDAILHYNSIQVWIAIIIAILSASGQFLKYKKTDVGKPLKAISVSALIALAITALISFSLEISTLHYVLLLFASLFAISANFQYLLTVLKGKIRIGGASVAHVGFALILLGTLLSNHNKEVISINKSGIDFGDSFDAQNKRENILLRKGDPVEMSNYIVTYLGDSVAGVNNYYRVKYARQDKNEEFILYPNAQINPQMGLIANPDTRHYLTKDIYTHVTSVPDKEAQKELKGKWESQTIAIRDTFYTAKAFVVLTGINPDPPEDNFKKEPGDVAAGVKLELYTLDDRAYSAEPVYLIRNNNATSIESEVKELGVTFRVEKILPDTHEIVLGIKQEDTENDFIIMKAIVFPFINVLWLGCIIMAVGIFISIIRRYQDNLRKFSRAEKL